MMDFLRSVRGKGTGVCAGGFTGMVVVVVVVTLLLPVELGVGDSADREELCGGTGIGTGVCDCAPPGVIGWTVLLFLLLEALLLL